MKKILCLLSFALLVTLTGCKDARTSISNGDEALITVGKTEITKDEIYTALKSESGVTAIISKLTNFIIDKEVAECEWFVCNTGINTTHLKVKTQDILKKFLPYTHHRPRIVDL